MGENRQPEPSLVSVALENFGVSATAERFITWRRSVPAVAQLLRSKRRLLGFDHEKFTYRYHGLDQKLTGVEKANVIEKLIA